MRRTKRFTQEKIIGVQKEREAGGKVDDVCRRKGISSATFYTWQKNYCGMDAAEAERLREFEAGNARLKPIVADQMLDVTAMTELLPKNWEGPWRSAKSWAF